MKLRCGFLPGALIALALSAAPARAHLTNGRAAAAGTYPAAPAAPQVTLISPNGLQEWEAGATRNILFTSQEVSAVRIEASSDDGGSWSDVVASTPASAGTYPWTVSSVTAGTYRIRVSDASNGSVTDTSDLAFAVVPELTGHEFDHVFFSDSPTPVYYDASYAVATAPSTLVTANGSKCPVSTDHSVVGNYALRLDWSSEVGGGWAMANASIGWVGHDVTGSDSLSFRVFTETATPDSGLPCLYLEDTTNAKTPKIPLTTRISGVTAGAWQRITIPLQPFKDNPGPANLTRIKTIFLGQQQADATNRVWYLDDFRMTGPGPVTGDSTKLIVVLGSSTAAGTGASTPDSSWVGRYRTYIHGLDSTAVVVNLAVGGYTTYQIMPTGFVPPTGRPLPDSNSNITRALAYKPWAVVVNLPSNDVAYGYSVAEQIANYDSVLAVATGADVPLWITTAQPRNFASAAQRAELQEMTDSTFARYSPRAIDFWNGVAAPDGTILPQYNSGDGIHLNDAGHLLLSQRAIGAGIWEEILTAAPPPAVAGPRSMLFQNYPNPVRDSTRIGFRLGTAGRVSLAVYDVTGRRVATLAEESMPAGEHWFDWSGPRAAAGIFFYRLAAPGVVQARKMVLIR